LLLQAKLSSLGAQTIPLRQPFFTAHLQEGEEGQQKFYQQREGKDNCFPIADRSGDGKSDETRLSAGLVVYRRVTFQYERRRPLPP
jgi:hypothetical protein